MRTERWHKEAIKRADKPTLRAAIERAVAEFPVNEWIYVASTTWTQNWYHGQQSVYKIGKTTDIDQRTSKLKTSYDVVAIVHCMPARYAELAELALHTLFAQTRFQIGGREMFVLPDDDYRWLITLSTIHGGHIVQALRRP